MAKLTRRVFLGTLSCLPFARTKPSLFKPGLLSGTMGVNGQFLFAGTLGLPDPKTLGAPLLRWEDLDPR